MLGVGEERLDEPDDGLGAEVAEVGVEPAEEVAVARVQRLPQRVALARARPGLGQHVGLGDDAGAGRGGDRGRGVGRAVVDHDDLVDEARLVDEMVADLAHDRADRCGFVAGRQAHRDRVPQRALRRAELVRIHLASLWGTRPDPVPEPLLPCVSKHTLIKSG